jgi:hypothetical protein
MQASTLLATGLLLFAAGCSRPDRETPGRVVTRREDPEPAKEARNAEPDTVPSLRPKPPAGDSPAARIEQLGGSVEADDSGTVVRVRLSGRPVKDADLAVLAKLPRLRRLDLSFTRVTDAGLPRLKGLEVLEALDLSGTEVTGAGLAHLAALPRLAALDLGGTAIGDMDLDRLKDLPALKILVVRGAKVSEAAAEALRKARPELTVDR